MERDSSYIIKLAIGVQTDTGNRQSTHASHQCHIYTHATTKPLANIIHSISRTQSISIETYYIPLRHRVHQEIIPGNILMSGGTSTHLCFPLDIRHSRTDVASIQILCRFISSTTISSSISFTTPGFDKLVGFMRSQLFWNVESLSVKEFRRETKTTSCFLWLRSLPMTTWWPYRSRAAHAFGMRSAGSVSNC